MPAIDYYFDILLDKGGSDLHLSVGHPATIRVKGELVHIDRQPLDERKIRHLMDELLEVDQQEHFHAYRDLDFAYGYQDKARFRANYLYKTTGPGAVFRTIPSDILTVDDLGLPRAVPFRTGPGHWPDGKWQEHHARRDARSHQPRP